MRKVSLLLVAFVFMVSFALIGCGTNSQNNKSSSTGTTKSKEDKTIQIGYDSYFEDIDITEVWKQLLQKKGWKVTTTNLNIGALFSSMAKGGSNGVDTFLDVWMPHTHKTYMDKYGAHLTKLGVWYKATKIGLVVPQYVYDQGIHSLADLNAHASMFHNKITGITAGAGETMTVQKKVIPDYNLKLKLVNSSEPVMLSSLEKAEKAKQPIVVTLWSPHWIFGQYKLKYLSDPKGSFGSTGVAQIEANKAWASNHPSFVKYMKNFKMTDAQLNSLALLIKKDGQQKGAQEWISKNQDIVNTWLGD